MRRRRNAKPWNSTAQLLALTARIVAVWMVAQCVGSGPAVADEASTSTLSSTDALGTTTLTLYPDGWRSTFNGTYNADDIGYGVAIGPDGFLYVVGQQSLGSHVDVFVRKYDAEGTVLWTQTYDGPAHKNDIGHDVAVDAMGNVYVVGEVDAASSGAYSSKIWLRKYNASGVIQWTMTQAGAPGHNVGSGVAVDAEGNLYAIGRLEVDGHSTDIWVNKYTSTGAVVWSRTFNSPICDRVGQLTCSTLGDVGFDIAVANGGTVYATGYENYWPEGTWEEVWVAKLTAAGEVSWIQRYDSPDHDHDHGFSVAVDPAGNAYIAVRTVRIESDGLIQGNALIQKYASVGTLLWTDVFDLSSSKEENAQGVAVDGAGMVHAIGSKWVDGAFMDGWVRTYDARGLLLRERTWNSPADGGDFGQALAVDGAGNLYAVGAESQTGQGTNLWVRKYLRSPEVDPMSPQTVREGQPLSVSVSAHDPDSATLTLTGQLANGSALSTIGATFPTVSGPSPLTGTLSWTPTVGQAGTHVITLTATDPEGLSDVETLSITVQANPVRVFGTVTGFTKSGARLLVDGAQVDVLEDTWACTGTPLCTTFSQASGQFECNTPRRSQYCLRASHPQISPNPAYLNTPLIGTTQPEVQRDFLVSYGGCFIATAAYGSPLAPELVLLRSYRDEVLARSALGQQLIALYYRMSPPVARFIADKPWLRAFVRQLLKPFISWAQQLSATR